jgi:Fe-S-cluster containining protein
MRVFCCHQRGRPRGQPPARQGRTTPMKSESDNLCEKCSGLCCRYFALPLDNPTTPRDYDNIRWYLMHENVIVYIEKRQWYIGILNRCKNLQDDNRCGIYLTRPKICREYTTDNCDWHGGEYDFEKFFTSADQLMEYAKTKLKKSKRTKVKKTRTATGKRKLELPLV